MTRLVSKKLERTITERDKDFFLLHLNLAVPRQFKVCSGYKTVAMGARYETKEHKDDDLHAIIIIIIIILSKVGNLHS